MDNNCKSKCTSADGNVNKSASECAKYISHLQKWYTTEAKKLQNDILRANMQLEATRNQCGTMINEVKKRQAELEMEVLLLKNDDNEKAMGVVVTGEIDYVSQREGLVDRLKEIKMEIDCLSTQVNRIRTMRGASGSSTSVNHNNEPSCSTVTAQKTVDPSHVCSVCQVTFINRTQLEQHNNQFSMEGFLKIDKPTNPDTNDIQNQLYFCHIADCGLFFQQIDQFRQHMQTHIVQSYSCRRCTRRFPSYSLEVCAHEKIIECKECKQRFASDKMLKIHLLRRHLAQSPLACSTSRNKEGVESAMCTRRRVRFKNLMQIKARTKRQRTHFCNRANCSKIFKSVAALKAHLKNHGDMSIISRKMSATREQRE